ncbi:MAG TPA: ferritin-like domain-containing protein [Planctomycetaceae bacterium]|nr:ferritin-like domain-containing protein [Planctomycetaceae bacterium]
MAGSSADYHEPVESLRPETIEHHRALVSLMEELEAIDWYQQRIDATRDDELRRILAHNRDEEKEHAAMALEWLRRCDPQLDAMLRAYLFTDGSIAGREEEREGRGPNDVAGSRSAADGSLGLGSLRSIAPVDRP